MSYILYPGNCLDAMKRMEDNSVDSVVTDPPYGLSFMGKKWDYDVPSQEIWAECLRVLKPGGHLLAFAGTRTQHRMAVRIEDAGFEIRDMIAWVYSSGFPKSHNMDNHRGKLTCNCDGLAVPYTHEKDLSRESQAQCDVPSMRNPDVSQAEYFSQGGGQVLQQGVQEQGAPITQRQKLWPAENGASKPCVEGGCDAQTCSRELQGGSLCASTRMGQANGAEGRLHHGASSCNGSDVRVFNDAGGSGESYRPQSIEQPSEQFGDVADQRRPQARGVWPICNGCGKPIVPKGIGTSLKPAHEPITVARKPLIGTVAENVLEYGTGGLNINGCRVATDDKLSCSTSAPYANDRTWNASITPGIERVQNAQGRWPANLIHDGSDEVVGLFPTTTSGAMKSGTQRAAQDQPGSVCYGTFGGNATTKPIEASSGSAARFFYCAKASKRDRDEGLEGFVLQAPIHGRADQTGNNKSLHVSSSKSERANTHPTVKPTDLMRYLCRLVTQPGGVVLDPFMGSGSTGKAAMLEGFQFIGCELSPEYMEIARARIDAATTSKQPHTPDLFGDKA
jgi:DNA modification methylase